MHHIVNLSINTATYKIFQAIERLRNMLEYNDSQDAHFKLSKWKQRLSIKTITMNRVMDTRFELQSQGGCRVISCFLPISGEFIV